MLDVRGTFWWHLGQEEVPGEAWLFACLPSQCAVRSIYSACLLASCC
ncbi:rCG43285 [Rattus norvegicus]|uniref:RCG43285 n=1 Tax=Rattus norvegicus TaxID=10116 RepID=A6IWC9_RAT|nr:rCG43285 [Rattus norvegicus]